MHDARALTIGEVARRAEVNVETIRFYEREGLLAQPARPARGFRHYPTAAVERVRFIRRAKALGFTLGEVQQLLSLRATTGAKCEAVRSRALSKVAQVEQKMRDLRRLRTALVRLAESCHGECEVDECGILDSLSGHAPTAHGRKGGLAP
ncbi:MAG TPA: MerR family transcriptional regulator [Polyangiaceae bacterium]|nr:MerR family transcriptional regulator [Polyangiaceae bacterium]